MPPPPCFKGLSFPLARFGGCATLFRSMGYYELHVRTLIWELSFAKMLFSIFFPENASQIGLSIPEEIVPLSYQGYDPKNQRVATSGYKSGVQGLAPGVLSPAVVGGGLTLQGPPCNGSNGATYRWQRVPALFLPISREKWGPSPGRRGNGALRPEVS